MTNASFMEINGREIALDKEGYLIELADWDEDVASNLAAQEQITLGPAHWEVINLLRIFYNRHQMSPANRALVNLVKRDLGADKGKSVYLMKLFRGSPAKTASKISGLPKPENCL
ncbi:MAG: tRNA 2-thiouridine synthesizing protein E [Pseudohongiellaceae bacterium]|jgi:tRNA 2-thiouridine synthesizing protein E|nr:TusE/DsrC/DsvC family sulfur relay protein [Pseudomonadota bacterium]